MGDYQFSSKKEYQLSLKQGDTVAGILLHDDMGLDYLVGSKHVDISDHKTSKPVEIKVDPATFPAELDKLLEQRRGLVEDTVDLRVGNVGVSYSSYRSHQRQLEYSRSFGIKINNQDKLRISEYNHNNNIVIEPQVEWDSTQEFNTKDKVNLYLRDMAPQVAEKIIQAFDCLKTS